MNVVLPNYTTYVKLCSVNCWSSVDGWSIVEGWRVPTEQRLMSVLMYHFINVDDLPFMPQCHALVHCTLRVTYVCLGGVRAVIGSIPNKHDRVVSRSGCTSVIFVYCRAPPTQEIHGRCTSEKVTGRQSTARHEYNVNMSRADINCQHSSTYCACPIIDRGKFLAAYVAACMAVCV